VNDYDKEYITVIQKKSRDVIKIEQSDGSHLHDTSSKFDKERSHGRAAVKVFNNDEVYTATISDWKEEKATIRPDEGENK
jgi:hypothetical protein